MRVAMVAYAFYEGNARLQQYCTALVKRGDEVDMFCLRREDEPPEAVVNGVHVHAIQVRVVNERRQITFLVRVLRFLFLAAWVLTRRHLARPYAVVHVHSVPDFLIFSALVPRLSGSVVLLDIHDILPEFYASKFQSGRKSLLFRALTLVERVSCRFAHHVIIANDLWRERLTQRSVAPERCTAIGNYPDPDVFQRHPRSRTDGRFRLIYPGSLNHHQGLDVAIRAFARVVPELPEAEFVIHGEGPSKEELIALAVRLQVADRVHFREMVPIRQIARLLADADAAVVPKRASSVFGNEAASTKILECMTAGVPVIVSRTKVDSFYHSDRTVQFFESENEADLAECILRLARHPELRERLASNAWEHARLNSWAVKKELYLSVVDSLAGRRSEREHRRTVSAANGGTETVPRVNG